MKKIILSVIAIIIIASGTFFAGLKYSQTKNPTANQPANALARFQQRGTKQANDGGFTAGEIIAKDDKSITIKLPSEQGGSKIVFFSENTLITKTASGTPQDLIINEQIMVTGATNQDGSVTAQSIQLRP